MLTCSLQSLYYLLYLLQYQQQALPDLVYSYTITEWRSWWPKA